MNKGTALALGFLAGVLLADKIKAILGSNTARPVTRIPAKTTSGSNLMGLGAGISWDCTQQDWMRKNIINYNNPFGG